MADTICALCGVPFEIGEHGEFWDVIEWLKSYRVGMYYQAPHTSRPDVRFIKLWK
jgi:hypothetical protein